MENLCSKCFKSCVHKARPAENELFGAACDSCKLFYCKSCAELKTTEAHTLALSERILLFYCQSCKDDFKNMCCNEEKLENLFKENKRLNEVIELLESEHDDSEARLKKQIIELNKVIIAKDDIIRREKRKSMDFQDDVFSAEKSLEEKIKAQEKIIRTLKKEIGCTKNEITMHHKKYEEVLVKNKCLDKELEKIKLSRKSDTKSIDELIQKNENLHQIILEEDTKRDKLMKELEELKSMRIQMLTTISTLESDNEVYANENKKINEELFQFRQRIISKKDDQISQTSQSHCNIASIPTVNSPVNLRKIKKPKNNLVILTDDFGKMLYDAIDKSMGDSYVTQLVTKPYAGIRDIIQNSDCYVKDLTDKDYVVLMAGLNDTDIRKDDIILLSNMCFRTNLIVCNLPYKNDYGKKCLYVSKINRKLREVTQKLQVFSINIGFLDLAGKLCHRDFCKISNFYLNKFGSFKIGKFIKHCVQNFSVQCITNLKYVPIDDKIFSVNDDSFSDVTIASEVNFLEQPLPQTAPVRHKT